MVTVLLAAACSGVDSRIAKHRDKFSTWPAAVQGKVVIGQIDVGFTPQQERVALGEPDYVSTRTTVDGTSEVCSFRDPQPRFAFGIGLGFGRGVDGDGRRGERGRGWISRRRKASVRLRSYGSLCSDRGSEAAVTRVHGLGRVRSLGPRSVQHEELFLLAEDCALPVSGCALQPASRTYPMDRERRLAAVK